MNKIKYLLALLLCYFCFFENVNAYSLAGDDCSEQGKCLVLCNYKTVVELGGSYANGYQPTKISRNITIYYNYSSKDLTVKWQSTTKDISTYTKGPGAIDYIFSNSGNNIDWVIESSPSLSNFVCPQNGYLDTSDLNGGNEICFDNDGISCKEKYSDIGTAFAHHGGFVSQEKDYDYEEHINNYKQWIFGDIKEDITSGKFDVETELTNKIYKDFKTNFLYGNDIPEFITNSSAFQNIENSVLVEYNKVKQAELTKAEKEYNKGNITEDEYGQIKNNWDNDTVLIEQQGKNAFANIKSNITWLSDFNVSDYCSSYLGNPQTNGSPAYYLQFLFNLIKYLSIILLFVLTIADFAKAIVSSNQDAIKKAVQTAIKRLIIVVIIFLLPILVKFLLTTLGIYSPSTCGVS